MICVVGDGILCDLNLISSLTNGVSLLSVPSISLCGRRATL